MRMQADGCHVTALAWWSRRLQGSTLLATVTSFMLASCSIHPLPQDVTRETTTEIVRKIRCEARDALDDIVVDFMRQSPEPRTRELAEMLATDQIEAIELFTRHDRELDRNIKTMARVFTTSAVAFDFSFKIKETNDQKGAANFSLPMANSSFTIGFAAGAKLDRENTRQFQMASTFFELHKDLKRSNCVGIAAQSGNFIYPITGKIGLYEVFRTFIELHLIEGATFTEKFTDQLTFTTTLNAGATPKITLNPGPVNHFRLAEANIDLSAVREDEHQVKIAVERGSVITTFADAAAAAKGRALAVLDDLRTQNFFVSQRALLRRLNLGR